MTWRKWFVRGLVFLCVAGPACALVWFQRYTNPSAVRAQVLAKFKELFPGGSVSVEAARLRILGGISVFDLRLARKDDPDKTEILNIPSALLFHDKEKLVSGGMALRKVELDKPTLLVVRNPDGSWNLSGLAGPAQLDKAFPTIVVQQGTIRFIDRAAHGSGLTLDLSDVNLTLINDPISLLRFEGSASSAIVGKLLLSGQWRRDTGELALTLKAQNVPLDSGWSERIVCSALADKLQGLVVEGKAEVNAELAYRPGQERPFSYEIKLEVRDGKVRHPRLPLPWEKVEALLVVNPAELRLERLKACSGAARVELRAQANMPFPEQSWEAQLDIKHLPLTDHLFAPLPQKLRDLKALFHAEGTAAVRLSAAWRDGRWAKLANGAPPTLTLLPESLSGRYERFPYPLSKASGIIRLDLLAKRTEVDITCEGGERPVYIKGFWEGDGAAAECNVDIVANEVPVDERLLRALPPALEKRVRAFNATGKFDIKANLRKKPPSLAWDSEYHLRVFGAAVCWNDCPFLVGGVSGLIDLYPDRWEFHDFQGIHKNGSQVFLRGQATPRPDGTMALALELSGKQLALDEELKAALERFPGMAKAWDTLRPSGRINFACTIDRPTPAKEDMDVNLNVQGATLLPRFFPCTLEACAGRVRYFRNRVEIDRLYARRRDTEISVVAGTVDLDAAGGYYADLSDVRFRKLRVDDEFIQAAPLGLRSALKSLDVKGHLAGKFKLVASQASVPGASPAPADVFWDGQVWFNDIAFSAGLELSKASGTFGCRGRYDGRQLLGVHGNLMLDAANLLKQPVRNAHVGLTVEPDQPHLLLLNVKAPLHGGDVTGQIRLDFASSLRYDLNLTASQIDLETFGRHNMGSKSQIKGIGIARLVLSGQGSDLSTLDGSGTIDIPSGHLLNIPLLLDLLKFLGLTWPDRTFFDEAHAAFAVRGTRVHATRLELLGRSVSLYGTGEFNLDGTDLALDLYPSWARVEQLLPPAIRAVPPAITKNLLIIEMRGKVGSEPGDIQLHKKALPILIDPFLHLRDRMNGTPSVAATPRGTTPMPPRLE